MIHLQLGQVLQAVRGPRQYKQRVVFCRRDFLGKNLLKTPEIKERLGNCLKKLESSAVGIIVREFYKKIISSSRKEVAA